MCKRGETSSWHHCKMPWTFSWLSKPKKPWIQHILKVVIWPLISRWRFEGLSLCHIRFLLSQTIFSLSLQQFSLSWQHTQAFCFPALNIPLSRILVRLDLIGTQNQLKTWKDMHKLQITWIGWWNSNRRPHQPAPDKKATLLALLMLCEGMWMGPMPGSQLQFTHGWTPVSGADSHHWNVCHQECPPGRRLLHITSARLVPSVWEALHGHPLNKRAWCWLLNPGTSHLVLSQCKGRSFISCCCSRQTLKERRAESGKEAQTKDSWHESGKKANTESQSAASAFLQAQCLALSSFSVTRLCSFTRAWTWTGLFLLFHVHTYSFLPFWAQLLSWGMMPTIEGDMWEHVLEKPEQSRVFQFRGNPIWDHISTPNPAWKSMLTAHIRPTHLHTLPRLLEISFHSSLFREESLTWTLTHHNLMS